MSTTVELGDIIGSSSPADQRGPELHPPERLASGPAGELSNQVSNSRPRHRHTPVESAEYSPQFRATMRKHERSITFPDKEAILRRILSRRAPGQCSNQADIHRSKIDVVDPLTCANDRHRPRRSWPDRPGMPGPIMLFAWHSRRRLPAI